MVGNIDIAGLIFPDAIQAYFTSIYHVLWDGYICPGVSIEIGDSIIISPDPNCILTTVYYTFNGAGRDS